MAHLSVSLLGPFEVALDGEPVTDFESNKVRALLAYLAVEADRPHRREALATLLWPGRPDRAARANLRRDLSSLRKAIGDRPPSGDHHAQPPFLAITRETIQFNSASDCWVDVTAFWALVDLDRAGGPTTEELQEAVALYRGPFLEGFSLRDSPPFDDWSLLTRERLHRLALTALHRLGQHLQRLGDLGRACEVAHRQVELEPWLEEAHRELMRLLALSGQRSAALAQYETCRRVLMEELRIEPAGETTSLYERIRDGAELPTPPQGPPHNLPAPLTPLVGRQILLTEIGERLRDPGYRLLSLVGPGGSGKTRLALEVAARQIDNFRHGVFFVSLAPLQSAEAIVPTVAQALGFSFTAGTKADPWQQLLDYLRGKHILLLLDNFEHLLEGAGLIAHILQRAPQVKVMTTSRARLNVRGEHLLPIPGMDVPPEEAQELLFPVNRCPSPPDISRYSAVQLFLRSARRVQPHFEPQAGDLAYVAHICRLVEGMPLAILLAASWMRMLSPAEIVSHISLQDLEFLETEWRDIPVRQRSMRAVFDHSWSLLSDREREVFAGLSVFRGGFLLQAAQAVTGVSLRELMALVDQSLVQPTPAGRYEVHELLRQYGEERLARSPAAEQAVRDRHCAYYASALQSWEAALRGPGQKDALAEIEADIENARAVWDRAVDRGDIACIRQAMDGLCRFNSRRGHFREGEAACASAAEKLAATEGELTGEGLRALAKVWGWQGSFNSIMGRIDRASMLLEQGLTLLDGPPLAGEDTRSERAFLLEQLGHTVRRRDPGRARQCWAHSLSLYQALGDRWETAALFSCLAELDLDEGEHERAEHMLQESLTLRQALGDRAGIAHTLLRLSYAGNYSGRFEEGERMAREAVSIYQDMRDRSALAVAFGMLGAEIAFQGRFTEAHRVYEDAAALREELGMRGELASAQNILGWIEVNLGLYDQARAHYESSLALRREMGSLTGIPWSLRGLGQVALGEAAYSEARKLLHESAIGLRDTGQAIEYALALTHLGYAERGLGRTGPARECLTEALRVASGIGSLTPRLFSLCLMALLLADEGEGERAIELYALASRYPYVGNSRFREDISGKHITALAATLPPEVVTVARARGRARDLETTVAKLLTELEATSGGLLPPCVTDQTARDAGGVGLDASPSFP